MIASTCALIVGCPPGNTGPGAAKRAQINDPSAEERILAIREAGEHRDRSAVPLLVDRLEDEDEGVRFYAILALERIVGTRMGYDYRATSAERTESVQRWRHSVRTGTFAQAPASQPALSNARPNVSAAVTR